MSVTAGIPRGRTCPACGGLCQRRDARQQPMPPYQCQILGTRIVLIPSFSLASWTVWDVFVPGFDIDVSWSCKAKCPPGLQCRYIVFTPAYRPSSPPSHSELSYSVQPCSSHQQQHGSATHGGLDEADTITVLTQVVSPTVMLPK